MGAQLRVKRKVRVESRLGLTVFSLSKFSFQILQMDITFEFRIQMNLKFTFSHSNNFEDGREGVETLVLE